MLFEQLTDRKNNLLRQNILSWMAALCVASNETRAAEGYMLELLAWCASSLPDRNELVN